MRPLVNADWKNNQEISCQRVQPRMAERNETFDRVERTARFFGGPGYSVSNFVEHIINEHLDNNAANYEGWFTLISKSF